MKICEICKEEFEETKSSQKYCPKCGKNPNRALARQRRNRKTLEYHMGIWDEPVEKECKQCGKKFTTLFNRKFCSESCQTQYRIENATCTFCGKNLYNMGITINNPQGGKHFCSDNCRKAYNERIAREKGEVHICPNCHKEFWKKTTFCSKKCYAEAKANGWQPENKRKVTIKCKRCGTDFETLEMFPQKCCPKCLEELRVIRQKKLLQQQAEYDRKRKEEQIRLEEEKFKQGVQKNGLCLYCQATNSTCERVKSKFTCYPAGSRVVQGKVLECPSFVK